MSESTTESARLRPEQLRRRLDEESLPFRTTAEVEPLHGTIGQPRALDAIEFGAEVESFGFNLFVAGQPGSGRESTVRDFLEGLGERRQVQDDWLYVHNFDEPDRPRAIRLRAGRGSELARDMGELLEAARQEIPRAFESEDYARRREEALAQVASRRDALMEEAEAFARERGFAVQATPVGLVAVPVAEGRPLSREDVARLSPQEQEELEARGEQVNEHVGGVLRELRRLEKQAAERVAKLNREVVLYAVGPLFDDLEERWSDEQGVLAYLEQVKNDLPEHTGDFRPAPQGEEQAGPLAQLESFQREERLGRYSVNVVVDNSRTRGAPVLSERNPTYYNLLGRINYRAAMGTMVTDFRHVTAGALHRANGGFLVLHAIDVLRNPFAWEALKRALLAREIRIENLAEQLSPVPTATIRPEPIPLDLKVVLIGAPGLYHLLFALDEDVRELFKVKAEFAPEMEWSDEHVECYAAFVSRCVASDGALKHFDRSGVARLVEHGARLRDDQRKLSTRLLEIADLVSEASFWAGKAGRELVTGEDVAEAIARKEYRSNFVEERVRELIADRTITIDTEGERVGQVNGLSILDLGDYRFGRPSRVTARVALGRGGVRSIEREIELSGPIHSKGVLILSGYLSQQYAQEWPLALSATLAFEQAYEEVDGDSASSTELYALLSALSGLPLAQGIAVTGSVDQHGEVQAVGGVTQKVGGFFAVCKARGLTGEQGVVVPTANVPHLMLRDEVVEAVASGSFHLYAVQSVDEGIELLTGRPAGRRGADGAYPEGTVHRLVEDRLRDYAGRLRTFAADEDGGSGRGASG